MSAFMAFLFMFVAGLALYQGWGFKPEEPEATYYLTRFYGAFAVSLLYSQNWRSEQRIAARERERASN